MYEPNGVQVLGLNLWEKFYFSFYLSRRRFSEKRLAFGKIGRWSIHFLRFQEGGDGQLYVVYV